MSVAPVRTATAYVGISQATSDEEPATLGDAIHDAALQAVAGGHGEMPLQVVHIEFTAHNPHITQYKVIATPST